MRGDYRGILDRTSGESWRKVDRDNLYRWIWPRPRSKCLILITGIILLQRRRNVLRTDDIKFSRRVCHAYVRTYATLAAQILT